MLCQHCKTIEVPPRKPGGRRSKFCSRNCEQAERRQRSRDNPDFKKQPRAPVANAGLRGEALLESRGAGYSRPGRRSKNPKPGVHAVEPAGYNDAAVCYVVSTKHAETEHDSFEEARTEYLLRTGRMSA